MVIAVVLLELSPDCESVHERQQVILELQREKPRLTQSKMNVVSFQIYS